MIIINLSARHPTHKFRALVDFVAARTKHASGTTLEVGDRGNTLRVSGGMAYLSDPDGTGCPLVRLLLSTGARYPRTTRHVPEVGSIVLRSWEEEFVLVLAHELRHVDQFVAGTFWADQVHAAEVDAERFAVRVLNQFRRARQPVPFPTLSNRPQNRTQSTKETSHDHRR